MMRKIIFVTLATIFLISSGFVGNEFDKNSEIVKKERACCQRGSHNGEIGEDHLYITVGACVTYETVTETMSSAHDRACAKAQEKARKAVALLTANP